ncbi:MAG TPA: hypothetical protein GXX46_07920 [Peptococcaceae bacterium]|nr:hypothetical protein [Peptococcaceae bacterium]
MTNIYPKCCFCNRPPAKGLYDGIFLRKKFICSLCEKKLLVSQIDPVAYEELIQNIKAILFGSGFGRKAMSSIFNSLL